MVVYGVLSTLDETNEQQLTLKGMTTMELIMLRLVYAFFMLLSLAMSVFMTTEIRGNAMDGKFDIGDLVLFCLFLLLGVFMMILPFFVQM